MPRRALPALTLILALAPPALAQRTDEWIDHRLATTPVDVDIENASIDDLVELLGLATGVDFVVTREARLALDDGISVDLRRLPARSLLEVVLPAHGLAWTVRHGAVLIRAPGETGGSYSLRIHDLSDLTFSIRDFAGPGISLGRDDPHWGASW